LNFLSQSIEKKSASLKVLVESNFEKFVRAKSTIDNVYREMVNPSNGEEDEAEVGFTRTTSRRTSRQNSAFSSQYSRQNTQLSSRTNTGFTQISSRQGTVSSLSQSQSAAGGNVDRRKNALIKEQEYGVLALKLPLLELKAKADDVWGPALGKRERESHLNVFMGAAEKQRAIFEVGASISDCIKRRDHEFLVEEYVKAKRLADEARSLVDQVAAGTGQLSEAQVFQIMLVGRMWSDIEDQIETFKRDLWRRLAGTHFSKQQHTADNNKPEEYMELIKALLELGVEDNPIWVWLFSRYDFLKQKITTNFERSKVEIEILRRKLAAGEKPTTTQIASHFKSATSDGRLSSDSQLDLPKINEVWEHIYSCLNTLLSTQGGILGEVLEFWETAKSFIDGEAQQNLPGGIDGNSRKHHRLSTEGVNTISAGAQDLINIIRDNILSFFTDPPTEDLSLLLSPISAAAMTPKTPKTPKSGPIQSFADNRLRIDPTNIPPPSPRRGESWEKFAFWPPYANSISGVHYLSKILHVVGTAACDMASLQGTEDQAESLNSCKQLITNVRDRCVQAACAAWSLDCDQAIVLEDWTRAAERPDITNLPYHLMNFEGFLLHNLQKILFIPEATRRPGSPDIIVPPSGKLIQMVKLQFVGGIYKIINGMLDHAESVSMTEQAGSDGLTVPVNTLKGANKQFGVVDASNKVFIIPPSVTIQTNSTRTSESY
jgi:exocyst complex component 2